MVRPGAIKASVEIALDIIPIISYRNIMKYTFTILEDGQAEEKKDGMSYKRILKSLVTANPKWTGWIRYINKKNKEILHSISNGKRIS